MLVQFLKRFIYTLGVKLCCIHNAFYIVDIDRKNIAVEKDKTIYSIYTIIVCMYRGGY